MSRMQSDTLQLQETFELLALSLAELMTVGAIIILMLIIDWQLALVCMFVVPVLTLIMMYWQRFARHSFMRIRRAHRHGQRRVQPEHHRRPRGAAA